MLDEPKVSAACSAAPACGSYSVSIAQAGAMPGSMKALPEMTEHRSRWLVRSLSLSLARRFHSEIAVRKEGGIGCRPRDG